jgi:tetratricopeptide (TPR) repeat protein
LTLAALLLALPCLASANPVFESRANEALLGEAADLRKSGAELEASGRYLDAVPIIQKRVQLLERIYGPFHAELAKGLTDWAGVEQHLGNYETALLLRRRVASIFLTLEGEKSINTAVALGNLGAIYRSMGWASSSKYGGRTFQLGANRAGHGSLCKFPRSSNSRIRYSGEIRSRSINKCFAIA